MKFLIQPDCWI